MDYRISSIIENNEDRKNMLEHFRLLIKQLRNERKPFQEVVIHLLESKTISEDEMLKELGLTQFEVKEILSKI